MTPTAGPTATSADLRPDTELPDSSELARQLGLTAVEASVVDAAIAAVVDPDAAPPTVASLLACVPDADLTLFAPDGRLRQAGVAATADRSILSAPVVVDDRLLLHLAGHDGLDGRLLPYARRLQPEADRLPRTLRTAAATVADALIPRTGVHPVVEVYGSSPADALAVVATALARVAESTAGVPTPTSPSVTGWVVRSGDLPASPDERDAFVRLWEREHALTGALLVVDTSDDATPPAALLERLATPVVLMTRYPTGQPVTAAVPVPLPTRDEQERLWSAEPSVVDQSSMLAARYDLDRATIIRAATSPDSDAAVRHSLRSRLDRIAQRLEPTGTEADLVVPPATAHLLTHLRTAAVGRHALRAAGLGAETTRGQGLSALLCGPSGTGKTLAAEVLAGSLGLDLYRVDLAAAVSKWIGETEKHLRELFDAAEAGGAVLLFDEADALFGKRTEVRDSHDRYANLEVSYLLQRMEDFRGVALLTTNMRSAIDPAFLRRLSVVIPFPHPGVAERTELWRRAFPPGVAAEGIDAARLAALDLTGGQIRTVARHAALAAAATGAPVTMAHIRDAAAAELTKHERPLSDLLALGAADDPPAGPNVRERP